MEKKVIKLMKEIDRNGHVTSFFSEEEFKIISQLLKSEYIQSDRPDTKNPIIGYYLTHKGRLFLDSLTHNIE